MIFLTQDQLSELTGGRLQSARESWIIPCNAKRPQIGGELRESVKSLTGHRVSTDSIVNYISVFNSKSPVKPIPAIILAAGKGCSLLRIMAIRLIVGRITVRNQSRRTRHGARSRDPTCDEPRLKRQEEAKRLNYLSLLGLPLL